MTTQIQAEFQKPEAQFPVAIAPGRSMTVHITRSAYGKVPVVTVQTLNQASAVYRAFIEQQNFGASEAGQCHLKADGKIVARVSYNGRVWAGAEYVKDATPIYQP